MEYQTKKEIKRLIKTAQRDLAKALEELEQDGDPFKIAMLLLSENGLRNCIINKQLAKEMRQQLTEQIQRILKCPRTTEAIKNEVKQISVTLSTTDNLKLFKTKHLLNYFEENISNPIPA